MKPRNQLLLIDKLSIFLKDPFSNFQSLVVQGPNWRQRDVLQVITRQPGVYHVGSWINSIELLHKLHKSCRFSVVFLTMKSTFQFWFAWLPPTQIFTCSGCCAQIFRLHQLCPRPLLQILLEFPGINGGLKNRKRFRSQLQVIRHCIYLIHLDPMSSNLVFFKSRMSWSRSAWDPLKNGVPW